MPVSLSSCKASDSRLGNRRRTHSTGLCTGGTLRTHLSSPTSMTGCLALKASLVSLDFLDTCRAGQIRRQVL